MVRYTALARRSNSMLSNILRRDLLRELVARDLKLRYRRSVLGILWSLMNPLLQLVIVSLIFSFILPLDIENYTLCLFIGLLSWIWLSSSLTIATSSIVDNRGLILRPGFFTISDFSGDISIIVFTFCPLKNKIIIFLIYSSIYWFL